MRPTLAPARCILPQLADVTSSTDGTEIEITRTTPSYASEQRSAELSLSGESGWGRWLVGAYWFDEDKYGALGLVYFLSANTTVMFQASYTLVEVTYRFGN